MSVRFFHCSFFFTRWMDGDALFPRLLSPSIILRNGPPCCSKYLPERGRCGLLFNSWSGGATWPHKLYYQGVVSLSSPAAGFIAAIAESMIDGPRFCSRFQFGRLYAVHVLRTTLFLPCRPLLFFALGVAWLGPASDELRNAVGRIFRQHICLFRVKTSFWVRQTEMEGPFLNANLSLPQLQMRR